MIKKFIILSLIASNVLAKDPFFGDIKRAELFEKTDFVVPELTINLSDSDFNNFFLRYQCERDMNVRYLNKNDDCYHAYWMNYDNIMIKAIRNNYIDKSLIKDDKDLKLIEKPDKTYEDFKTIASKYSNYTVEELLSTSSGLYAIPEYEAEKAGLTIDIDGDVTNVPNIKFNVGGKYTRNFEKLGYNIKIKKGTLFDRKQLRLRSEAVDPSFIREKIAYDICNIIELPSLSSNFAEVYFNKKYMGIFGLRDAFKSQWIEYHFGEKSTTHLYTCDKEYGDNEFFNCINDDEDLVESDTEFKKFQDRLAKTKTREELEKFFDVEKFMKWQALKYLLGSWDHTTTYHNQCLYMLHDTTTGNDMWIPLLYDFDSDFGAYNNANTRRTFNNEIYDSTNPLFSILEINDDNKELIGYMDEIMRKAFNPKKLIPRIDQLREFIDPYVKRDRTPDADGNLPGRVKRVNFKIEDYFSYEDFLGNTEFTDIKLKKYTTNSKTTYGEDRIIGLKRWVIERFKFVCENYKLDCSYAKEYLGEPDYEVKTQTYEQNNTGCHGTDYNCCHFTTTMQTSDSIGQWGIENGEWCLFDNWVGDCWSHKYGYDCCKLKSTEPFYYSNTASNWYGIENEDWCGITDIQLCPSGGEYPCCKGCEVAYTDTEDWGIEDGEWCSIPHSCKLQPENTTTIVSSVETTTSILLDETTTSVLLDETTTSVLPDETTTSVLSDETTTIVVPVETTSKKPESTTTTTISPVETTTSVILDETTTIVLPDETTTSVIPDETTTSVIPDETTTSVILDETTTSVIPKKTTTTTTTTTVSPIKTTSELPDETTTIILPEETTTLVLPEETTTIVLPDETTTTEKLVTTSTTTTTTTTKSTTTTTTTTEAQNSAEPTPVKCGKTFEMCGGSLFPNAPNCCESGNTCVKRSSSFHQCIPDYLVDSIIGNEESSSAIVEEPTTSIVTDEPTTTEPITTTTTTTTIKPKTTTTTTTTIIKPKTTTTTTTTIIKPKTTTTTTTTTIKPKTTTTTTTTTKPKTTTTTTTTTTTIVKPKTTTTTTTTTIKATTTIAYDPDQCSGPYEPCGGTEFLNYPSCCKPGYYCLKRHPKYYQCVPNSYTTDIIAETTDVITATSVMPKTTTTTTTTIVKPKTTTTTTKASTTSVNDPDQCSGPYDPCGGSEFLNYPNCCKPGYYCLKRNSKYHQCVPNSYTPEIPEDPEIIPTPTTTTTTTTTKKRTTTTTTTTTIKKTTTTTTTTTTTKAAYTPPPPPPPPQPKCAKAFERCNGNGFYPQLTKCCERGYYCNDYWNMCVPNPGPQW